MTVAIVEQSAIMFKSSIFFFHKFFTSVTRYFLVYLFAQGVNTHAYIKLYALFNRVRLKKTHTSHFSRQLSCSRTTTTTMFFSLAFLFVAVLATITHGEITEIVGSCQDLEATLMIKYLLFFLRRSTV